eukprot:5721269-Pyramimonas_sp.AAC.1
MFVDGVCCVVFIAVLRFCGRSGVRVFHGAFRFPNENGLISRSTLMSAARLWLAGHVTPKSHTLDRPSTDVLGLASSCSWRTPGGTPW